MAERMIQLRAFFSTKGGVGKSTLAVACAKLLAASGRKVALIDADVTGTSLSDGLDLCAPDVMPHADGGYDATVAPAGMLDLGATTRARDRRAIEMFRQEDDSAPRPAPPFLNDLLVYDVSGAPDVKLASMLWRHVREDGVLYLPSSPTVADLALASRWLHEEGRDLWRRQMAWVIHLLADQVDGLTDILFDMSPGTTGLVHDVLELCNHLALLGAKELPEGYPPLDRGGVRWRFDPLLITSRDRNDLRVAVEWYARNRVNAPSLRLVANRLVDPVEDVREDVRGILKGLGLQGAPRIDSVAHHADSLGRIFNANHDLALTGEVKALAGALGA
jgi:hypothetical protein